MTLREDDARVVLAAALVASDALPYVDRVALGRVSQEIQEALAALDDETGGD